MVPAVSYRPPERTSRVTCSKSRSRGCWPGWWALAALAAVFVTAGGAANPAAATVKPKGKSLGAAHVAWWQWALSLPLSTHPLNPDANLTCATGQVGKQWYIGQAANSGGTVTRDCTIPSGTQLVVAVANIACTTLEPFPFNGTHEPSLRACAAGVVDPQSPLFIERPFATLDGRSLAAERAPSPLFEFWVPSTSDNILSCAPNCAGTAGIAVADGYLLRLHPLLVGNDTLRTGGTYPAFDYDLDITYNITVVPRGHWHQPPT